jgi:hypothetical protein
MISKLILPVIFFILLTEISRSQCCSAGNPFFYNEQSTIEKKAMQLGLGYKYGEMDTYYVGKEPIVINDIEQSWYNYLHFTALYGLNHRLSLQADLGYFLNKNESYYREDWEQKAVYGLGDLGMTIKYLAYKNHVKKFSIFPSVGAKFPVGVFDQEIDNVKLPISLQPSSGSFKYLLSLFLNKGFKNPKFNLGFYGSYEYAQWIHSDNFDYKYGNVSMLSLIFSYQIQPNLTIGLEARNENRSRARRNNEFVIQSTGYSLIYSIPHLSYSFYKDWALSMNAEVPVYRYYNGIQLGNKVAFSVRVVRNINLNTRSIAEVQ